MSLRQLPPATWHRLAGWAFWLYFGAVLLATLMPVTYLKPMSAFTFWDKAEHGLAFAVLAWLALLVWPQRPLRLWLILLAFGGVIELLQAASGWRSGEWADWLADGIGLVFGWWLWLRTHRFLPNGLR
jgi:VanZ family protein